jgi:hypothetical protein
VRGNLFGMLFQGGLLGPRSGVNAVSQVVSVSGNLDKKNITLIEWPLLVVLSDI